MTAYLLYVEAPEGASVASAFVDLTPEYARTLVAYFRAADIVANVHPEFNKLVFDGAGGCVFRATNFAQLDGSKLVRASPKTIADVINELESHGGYGNGHCTRVTLDNVWWTCLDDELDVLVYTQAVSRKRIERLAIGTP